MMSARARGGARIAQTSLLVAATAALTLVAPTAAGSSPSETIIQFTNDAPGFKPNGFQSLDSPQVTFSDSVGEDLEIADFGEQSHGNALAVNADDASALVMTFRPSTRAVSLAFGNDDPAFSTEGDRAVLTLYVGQRKVGRVWVLLNRDDIMNQRITYQGHRFNRAVFMYDIKESPGLIEIVDNIRVGL